MFYFDFQFNVDKNGSLNFHIGLDNMKNREFFGLIDFYFQTDSYYKCTSIHIIFCHWVKNQCTHFTINSPNYRKDRLTSELQRITYQEKNKNLDTISELKSNHSLEEQARLAFQVYKKDRI